MIMIYGMNGDILILMGILCGIELIEPTEMDANDVIPFVG